MRGFPELKDMRCPWCGRKMFSFEFLTDTGLRFQCGCCKVRWIFKSDGVTMDLWTEPSEQWKEVPAGALLVFEGKK